MATEFFQEWRVADRRASVAEKLILQTSMRAIEEGSALPTAAAIAAAKRLRAVANDLFDVSMAEFTAKAAKFRRV